MFNPFDRTGDWAVDLPELIRVLDALADPNPVATLANAASLLNWYLSDINWVGFYLRSGEDEELVLGPFQGLPACIRIPAGRGVCGRAAMRGEVQIVPDVLDFPGHIACDSASRSELVIPLTGDAGLYGVLDIDSPSPGRFSEEDAESLGTFCRRLESLLGL